MPYKDARLDAESPTLTFLDAAQRVLEAAGTPLSAASITERALGQGFIETAGKTPAATMEARLATSIQRNGTSSPFIRTAPRTYALRTWLADGRISEPVREGGEDVRIVFYPTYDSLRTVLPIFAGMTRDQITSLRAAIWEHRGSFSENADWTNPDEWIPARLDVEHQAAAMHIWNASKKQVNPRHMSGHWLLATGYGLLADGPNGALAITARGRDFLTTPDGDVVRDLDSHEGLLTILAILAEQGTAARADLMPPWMDYLRRVSQVRAETTGRSFVYYRLRNLLARHYVTRVAQQYELTPAGLAWLKSSGFAEAETAAPDETRHLWDLVHTQRDVVREALRTRLGEMDPYAFEQLIAQLLDAMGYRDIEVTAPSGDKGVDVKGRIALGITEVTEVVQVKRQQANVQRPVLDMLRGSLHRFGAVKGTIISLSGFAKGARDAAFEPGAAPITLIDGDKLLDLLIANEIGVRSKKVEVLELAIDDFEIDAEAPAHN